LALDRVDFMVRAGEIHAVVGENGAGKSTLIRLLGGIHRPDGGEILLDGNRCRFHGPRDAIAAGIVTIPQELRLVPALSVAENIVLGDPPARRTLGCLEIIDRARTRTEARAVLAQLDFAPDLDQRVDRLSFAERQLVAIGKALRRRCRVLILDEPTAALETHEVERLFAVLARLRSQGTAIVYISHRLEEVVALADRCTVMRDGKIVVEVGRGAFATGDLVAAMTGRATEEMSAQAHEVGDPLLEEIGARPDAIALRSGEVLGLAGLLGSGTGKVLRRLFGAGDEPADVRVKKADRRLRSPAGAIAAGIGMVPGERALGLVMNLSVRDNILLASLGTKLKGRAADFLVGKLMELLDIRPRRPDLKVAGLSGGNQQKVIFAKFLARRVEILLLDEPTQGIDVAAKAQIHALLRDFARDGGGILVSSSDLAELAAVCGSVLAMHAGRITTRIAAHDGLDETRLRAAIGG
jgi:ABC-type sugar transport system ATPase subunit